MNVGLIERDILDALHTRYAKTSPGYPPRYAVAEQVRVACGFGGVSFAEGITAGRRRTMRTIDFVAQDCWEAAGLDLIGHEVKVSRSDWLHELSDPTKAEAGKKFCDRWFLVVADRRIVRDDLPEDWGLMAPDRAGKLRVVRSAPTLTPLAWSRTFRASLMRAVRRTANVDPARGET